jgi:2-heptyl-1-hydroxyquinolin-4(1H)-one methyltransferase
VGGEADLVDEQVGVCSLVGYLSHINNALFHSTPPALRTAYQQSIVRAAAPRSSYFVLTFDRAGFAHGPQNAMKPVTADELREVVSKYWIVDELRSARLHLNTSESFPGIPGVELRDEGHGRKSAPAWLLTAHRD